MRQIDLTTKPLNSLIKHGHTLDFRLNEPMFSDLRVGQVIEFVEDPGRALKVQCKIEGLLYYESFSKIIDDFSGSLFVKGSGPEILEELYKWWSKEEESKFGVLGIRARVVT